MGASVPVTRIIGEIDSVPIRIFPQRRLVQTPDDVLEVAQELEIREQAITTLVEILRPMAGTVQRSWTSFPTGSTRQRPAMYNIERVLVDWNVVLDGAAHTVDWEVQMTFNRELAE